MKTTAGWLVALLLGVAGCAEGPGLPPDRELTADEAIASSSQELRVEVTRGAVSYDFAHRDNLPHGIDGDLRYVFVAEPLNARVAVLDRFTGAEVGAVPAPPGGFLLPFSLRVSAPGHLVILDSGGFPDPAVPSVPRVYDYTFSTTGAFTASLQRTVSFAGLPLVFAEDVHVLQNGNYVVAESIIGALWVIRPDGTITPGVFPKSPAPEDAIGPLAPCFLPDFSIGGIPFAVSGNFGPGVLSLADRKGQLYFSSTCNGGLHRIPVASLVDSRTPDQRAADIVTVSPRPSSDPETLHGLAFNRWNPADRSVYATDSFHLRVLRIDTTTGSRQVLGEDPILFNFPVSLQFLPPVLGVTSLVVSSDQEHRLPFINAAISESLLQPPFVLTKMVLLPQ